MEQVATLQSEWEQLLANMQKHLAQSYYHLLSVELNLAAVILQQAGCTPLLAVLPNETIALIEHCLIAVGSAADEAEYRDHFAKTTLAQWVTLLKFKDVALAQQVLAAVNAKAPSSILAKPRFHFAHSFEALYQSHSAEPYQILKSEQEGRLKRLEGSFTRNRYVVYAEIIVSYVRCLIRSRQNITSHHLKQLGNFIESLGWIAATQQSGYEDIWHYLLPLQACLADALVYQHYEPHCTIPALLDWQSVHADKFGEGLLLLQTLAHTLSQTKVLAEPEIISWLQTFNRFTQRLCEQQPKTVTCQLLQAEHHQQALAHYREVFTDSTKTLIDAQTEFSKNCLELIYDLTNHMAILLGERPCEIALCVTGSSARLDRRPYSDIELVLFYKETIENQANNKKLSQVQVYIYLLLSGLEIAIKQLGETHCEYIHHAHANANIAGFHLDSSCHILREELFGTPTEILGKYFYKTISLKKVPEEDMPGWHDWVHNRKFYALLFPKFVYGNSQLLHDYQNELENYLKSAIKPSDAVKKLVDILAWQKLDASNFQRHQLIALSTFYDVLQHSSQHLTRLKAGEICNLKEAFYKPLTYLALSLKLYYGLLAEHPEAIFGEIAQQLTWGQAPVQRLLQVAWRYIVTIQNKLHLKKSYQEEEIIWLKPTTHLHSDICILTPKEYLGLSLIQEAIILPLYEHFTKQLIPSLMQSSPVSNSTLSPQAFSKSLGAILQSFLTIRHEPWVKRWESTTGLTRLEILNHPLMQCLADYPSPDGWSPTMEIQWREWLTTVCTLFQASHKNLALSTSGDSNRCVISGFPSVMGLQAAYDHFNLPAEITAQRFDTLTGEVMGNLNYSSSTQNLKSKTKPSKIFTYVWQDHTLFFKFKTGNRECLLGWEIAVEILHRLLGGPCQIAPGWPIKLTYMPTMGEPATHWGWVSLGIQGESLGRAMLTDAGLLKDNHADELKLLGRKKLYAIDPISYGQLFILALLTFPEDGQPWNFLLEAQTKYYRLIGIDNGQSFVNPWELDKNGNVLKTLNVKTMLYLLPNFKHPLALQVKEWITFLNVDLVMQRWLNALEEINKIYQPIIEKELKAARVPEAQWSQHNKLIVMKETQIDFIRFRLFMLQSWLKKYPMGTPQALLTFLDPLVAAEYEKHQGRIKTPQDYYALSPHTYVLKPDLAKAIEQHYQASNRSYQALLSNALQLSYIQLDKIAQVNYINHVKSIPFKGMAASQQRFFLTLIQQLSFIDELILAHCTELTDILLESILRKSSQLMKLDISYCSKLTERSWLHIGQYCKRIEAINLQGNRQFKKLGRNIFGFNDYKQLKILDISECKLTKENISIRLDNVRVIEEKTLNLKIDDGIIKTDKMIKIVLIGESGDGKSACLSTFTDGYLKHNGYVTVGVDFKIKMLHLDGKSIKLQIWDTSGPERFKSIVSSYLSSAHVIMSIVDITRKESYDRVQGRIAWVYQYANKNTPILIVGNKCDLEKYRQFTFQEGQQLANQVGAFRYLECSARTGVNIQSVFTYAARAAVETQIVSDILKIIESKGFLEDAQQIIDDLMNVLHTGLQKNIKTTAKVLIQHILDEKLYGNDTKLKNYIETRLEFYKTKHLAAYEVLRASRMLYQLQRSAPTNSPLSFLTNDIIQKILQQIFLVEKLSIFELNKIRKYAQPKSTLTHKHTQKIFWNYFFSSSEDLNKQQNTIIAISEAESNSPSNTR